MTNALESADCGNFSETIAQNVQCLISKLIRQGKNLIEEVCSEIGYTNPITLPGAAKIGQLLLFLKKELKPKQYEEAVANTLGWIAGIANQLLKLAPILGDFTSEQLQKISENLSPSALYKLAAGRTPLEVIRSILQKACTEEVSQKDVHQETKNYKEAQPKKQPTPWRYVGQGREYLPPPISEQTGLVIELLYEQKGTPRRFLFEDAVLLLAEKYKQAVDVIA